VILYFLFGLFALCEVTKYVTFTSREKKMTVYSLEAFEL